ncbi:hypothetical protein Desru_1419 [Desulforamulus ruminis DSM 2154]|uniref:Transposase IS200-like domain-containing protein n=1 Tax=Desulforamulus ruminis (strain ATCC 23193 / DSM 2154 / NCIMB 8452 / DL) TaxID=696281 RepID=F6DQB2_DESRL|nr:hypothetical protein Desru_1419 [Desulforamulus ruminis DSM 2154]
MQEQSIMLLPGGIIGKTSFWIVVIKRNTLNLWQDTRKDSEILAYVLMDNHLHILIRIDQTPLSKVMPYQASEPATPGAATRTMQPEIACW